LGLKEKETKGRACFLKKKKKKKKRKLIGSWVSQKSNCPGVKKGKKEGETGVQRYTT